MESKLPRKESHCYTVQCRPSTNKQQTESDSLTERFLNHAHVRFFCRRYRLYTMLATDPPSKAIGHTAKGALETGEP